MANPVFVGKAILRGVGDVDVQLFELESTHVRCLVSAGPGDVVLDDTTDGSLLHAYENVDDCCHKFGPCVFSTGRKLQTLDLSFGSKTESESFGRFLFGRYCGREGNWVLPRKCGILQKEGGFVHRYQTRWFLYHRNNWLSYWKSPRESLPLGVIDWNSVTRVGLPQGVLSGAGDFEVENVRSTSGTRVHHIRAKSSEARDRWVQVLLDGHTPPTTAPTNVATVAPTEPAPVVALEPADVAKWKPIFGVPLCTLLEIEERIGGVPLLVSAMTDFLAPRASTVPQNLFANDLAPAAQVLSVKSLLEQGCNPEGALRDGDVHTAATVLQKFLLEMPEPVCTAAKFQAFCDAAASDAPGLSLRSLVESLPPAHETLLRHVVAFLKLLSSHQDESGLTSQILAESVGCAILRELCVYGGSCCVNAAAAKAVVVMMEDAVEVFVDPPLLKAPVFKNLTWKLLLVGRLLRVTPDDVERKLGVLTEIQAVSEKLAALQADYEAKLAGGDANQAAAISAQMTKHIDQVQTRLTKLQEGFYNMEVPCGPTNTTFTEDDVAPKLLREVSDNLDLLKQEEINMRTAFRKGTKSSDRPTVDSASLRALLAQVGASVGLGDSLLDSEDMFHELWYLRGEEARPYTLPEFLDVVGKWMELRGLFRQYDKYKSGFVLVEDVLQAMREFGALWGYRPTPFHLVQLLHEFDIDARHGIIWEEFRMVMHRWIEEKKRGYDVGKDTAAVEVVRSSEVLVDQLKKELKCLYLKFESPRGGIDILCLGGLFEEVCHAFELGGTLSELFRLMRVMEIKGQVTWEMFVGVMSKWIILKQLYGNYSKDGGNTLCAANMSGVLGDLRTVWGCFDPRHGSADVATMSKEVSAASDTGVLTFEEFMNAMRFQVALKSIFELHDEDGTGTLTCEGSMKALKAVEDYCGQFPACSDTVASLMGNPSTDEGIAMTWAEFLVVSTIAVGDEFDGSS